MSELESRIVDAIRTVKDPEIPVNLYDLGLIYELAVESGRVAIKMTLTTPNCPVAELLPNQVREAVAAVDGVDSVDVELTWTPPWSGERMTEDARMALEMMGISWRDPHGSVGNRVTDLTIGMKKDRPPDR